MNRVLWILVFSSLVRATAAGQTGPSEQLEAAAGSLTIPELGLTVNAPEGTTVTVTDGAARLEGGSISVLVEEPLAHFAEDLQAAQEQAVSWFGAENFLPDTLVDGWALSFDATSVITQYFVWSRRTIGGQVFWCAGIAFDEAEQMNALAACKSLSAE